MRIITRAALVLAVCVVILGAYTRLTEAGLGCPDWPGCYGHLTVPQSHQIEQAQAKFPNQPLEAEKAWNEMIHRYLAGTLGLLIFLIAVLTHRRANQASDAGWRKLKKHAYVLLLLVVFQALLGMWTVTMMLMPLVVMGHLLGGFTLFVLLLLFERRLTHLERARLEPVATNRVKFGLVAGFVLFVQVALGGWTAANYSALACTQLPFCEGDWVAQLSVAEAFSLPPESATYQYGVLSYQARATIHVFHRIGALVTAAVLLLWFVPLIKNNRGRLQSIAVGGVVLLSAQVLLGLANVVFSLPLMVAVLHNAVALLLLSCLLLSIYYFRGDAKWVHA